MAPDVAPYARAQEVRSGGVAAAVVAALADVVGLVIARAIFDIPVLAPKGGACGAPPTRRDTPAMPCSRR
jgi:hypothetical protein